LYKTEDLLLWVKERLWFKITEGITVDKAYLNGSYLTNTATEESDIDILIVTENENDNLTGKVWRLTKRVNSRIEPYLIEKDRFINNKDSLLIDLVKRTGIEVTEVSEQIF
jgi:predicted nucleotidyltransferase